MVRSYYEQDDEPERSSTRSGTGEDAERSERGPDFAGERDSNRREGRQHRHCREDRDSDLEQIDHLHCIGAGGQAESDYINQFEPAMKARDDKLSTLPRSYVTERQTVLETLEKVSVDINAVRESLTCHLNESVRETFQHAWDRVDRRLEHCTGSPKLYPEPHDCEFPVNPGEDIKALAVRKAQYTDRVEAAEKQFDALAEEPDALKKRGTDLITEVTTLKTLNTKEPPDYRAAYAALLVAEYHARIKVIFDGIPSSNAYEDYLRQCLKCSIRGRRALMEIAGQLKVRECRADKRRARCDALKTNLADEITAEVDDLEDEQQEHQAH